MHFSDKLAAAIKAKNSCLMLGLDPHWEKLPAHLTEGLSLQLPVAEKLQAKADIYEKFSTDMVDACAAKVCGIKIQMGYFEALGSVGVKAVENIIAYVRKNHSDLIIMMDAKRGDIGSTSKAYSEAFLGSESPLSGDCVTVAPYMGTDSLAPFIAMSLDENKGLFVLAKTSNPSSSDIQDVITSDGVPVYKKWAAIAAVITNQFEGQTKGNNGYSCLGVVVGATHAEVLKDIYKLFKKNNSKLWMLCPGVGAQGGKIEDVLAIRDEDGLGVLIPVSRSVLYASNDENYLKAAQSEIEQLWKLQKIN